MEKNDLRSLSEQRFAAASGYQRGRSEEWRKERKKKKQGESQSCCRLPIMSLKTRRWLCTRLAADAQPACYSQCFIHRDVIFDHHLNLIDNFFGEINVEHACFRKRGEHLLFNSVNTSPWRVAVTGVKVKKKKNHIEVFFLPPNCSSQETDQKKKM